MLDKHDWEILHELRTDGRASFRQLAERLDLHPSTVIKRVERLEKAGIIYGYGARLDLYKLGFEFMAVVSITISKGHLLDVEKKLRSYPGVMAIYDVTGDYDALAMVACRDREQFSNLVKKILSTEYVERTNTHVILNLIKDPQDFVPQG